MIVSGVFVGRDRAAEHLQPTCVPACNELFVGADDISDAEWPRIAVCVKGPADIVDAFQDNDGAHAGYVEGIPLEPVEGTRSGAVVQGADCRRFRN